MLGGMLESGHVAHSVFFFAICLKEVSLSRFDSGKKLQSLFPNAPFCAICLAYRYSPLQLLY